MESIIGILGVLLATSVWSLPETKGQPLPLDLSEMQQITCHCLGHKKKSVAEDVEEEEMEKLT